MSNKRVIDENTDVDAFMKEQLDFLHNEYAERVIEKEVVPYLEDKYGVSLRFRDPRVTKKPISDDLITWTVFFNGEKIVDFKLIRRGRVGMYGKFTPSDFKEK